MAALSDVVKGVQKTNELLVDNVKANKRTAAMITAFVTGQQASFGDRLEASGEKGKAKGGTTKPIARPVKGSGGISGIAAKPTGLLGKLAGMLGGVGAALKGGIGIAAIGAGIAAFFTALGAGDMALEKMKATGEWLSGFMGQISGAIAVMIKDGSATALAGVFAAGALFGMVTGPRGKLKSIFGIVAIGAGIAAFFTALGVGDALLGEMKSTGEWLSKFMENISGAIGVMIESNTGFVAAGLFGASALFGFFSPGGTAKAAFGIAIIGAGIAAFFTALGAGDMLLAKMKTTGEWLGQFMKNIAGAMGEFSGPAGAVILGLIATGGIFGTAMIGPTVGIAAIGVAIGLFFAGIAVGDKLINLLNQIGNNTEPGSGFRDLMKNTAKGISHFGDIDNLDPTKMENLGKALPKLLGAIATFVTAQALTTLSNIGLEALKLPFEIIDYIFGTESANRVGEGPIAKMVKGMEPLKKLKLEDISKLENFALALDRFFESFKKLANFNITGNFTANLSKVMDDLGAALVYLPALVNGGSIEDDDANAFSRGLNRLLGSNFREKNFGGGLKKLIEEGQGDLAILQQGVVTLRSALNGGGVQPNINPLPPTIVNPLDAFGGPGPVIIQPTSVVINPADGPAIVIRAPFGPTPGVNPFGPGGAFDR